MTSAHPIGTTVRVRDDVITFHAGETGIVVERLDSPTEPRPVLVRFPDRSTALYADVDLEAVEAVPQPMLLDVEPRDPAPRCPHCAALEARVADLERAIDPDRLGVGTRVQRMIEGRMVAGTVAVAHLTQSPGHRSHLVRWEPGYEAWYRADELEPIQPSDLTDAAPERTEDRP